LEYNGSRKRKSFEESFIVGFFSETIISLEDAIKVMGGEK